MGTTVTVKLRLHVSEDELRSLEDVSKAYMEACNYVSALAYRSGVYDKGRLQKLTYKQLRSEYGLKSQMAISVTRTVSGKYKAVTVADLNGPITFRVPQCDFVSGRDWSINQGKGIVSINTLGKRIKVAYSAKGYGKYMREDAHLGGAKIVLKKGKAYLYLSVEADTPEFIEDEEKVVGIDRGIVNHAVTYDGKDTQFHTGRKIKVKRAKYKETRRSLQKRGTPSSRRRLRAVGRRESRYVSDVNHTLAKTLVATYGPGTTFVLEDLSGVRSATAMVRRRDRYVSVSWPYYDFQQKLGYKAEMSGSRVIYIDPRHTSQRCPVCGSIDKNARHRDRRSYECRECGYKSNDDRIAAMNIREKGLEKMKKENKAGG